jgi:hypothetical protein
MIGRLLVLLLVTMGAGFAGDWEFDHVVKAIESHYGARRTHIPFLGLASFVVNVAHPAGASGFKLAVFENLRSAPGYRDRVELDRFMDGLSSGGLHRVVCARSRRDGEATYIYVGEAGNLTKMLIATIDRDEATVIQVKVNIETLLKTIESPEHAGKWAGDARTEP